MIDRRAGSLPCNHKLAYAVEMLGKSVICCCSCEWKKTIEGRPPRKEDLPYEEYKRLAKEMNG